MIFARVLQRCGRKGYLEERAASSIKFPDMAEDAQWVAAVITCSSGNIDGCNAADLIGEAMKDKSWMAASTANDQVSDCDFPDD